MWKGVLRMKVLFKVDEPLKGGFNLKRGNRSTIGISFRYEYLPNFCYHCGRLGHLAKDCCHRLDGTKKLVFGPWMRTSQNISVNIAPYQSKWAAGPSFTIGRMTRKERGEHANTSSVIVQSTDELPATPSETQPLCPSISESTTENKEKEEQHLMLIEWVPSNLTTQKKAANMNPELLLPSVRPISYGPTGGPEIPIIY
ncbi:hypothetical protein REPUB_Repub05bG0094300 [Reevesia pubescens]